MLLIQPRKESEKTCAFTIRFVLFKIIQLCSCSKAASLKFQSQWKVLNK